MNKKLLYVIVMAICIHLSACKEVPLSQLRHHDPVTVSGTLVMVGNIPFQRMALRTQNITVPLIFNTNTLQQSAKQTMGKKVTLHGHIDIQINTLAYSKKSIKDIQILVDTIDEF